MKKVYYILLMVLLFSCSDKKTENKANVIDKQEYKNSLEELNRYMLQQESMMIDDYIKSQNLDFTKTGTGLRYAIMENNNNNILIEQGDLVTIKYEVSSLDGKIFYTSDNDGYKTFLVGRGGVESGLEEAILKLHEGDEAVLIIPSYLAHGLVGDGNKIPAKTTLIYKLKVIENKVNN